MGIGMCTKASTEEPKQLLSYAPEKCEQVPHTFEIGKFSILCRADRDSVDQLRFIALQKVNKTWQ